jgi:hypothetical protein
MNDHRRQRYIPSEEALGVIYDNPQYREELKQTSKQFLHLLRQELIQQYMRHRYSVSDDHD